MRFVYVRDFKGKALIDIREYYDAGGQLKPGKKGIALNVQVQTIAWMHLFLTSPDPPIGPMGPATGGAPHLEDTQAKKNNTFHV